MRYRFDVSCPRCSGPLEHVAGGTTSTWETRAVTRCEPCDETFVIVLSLRPTTEPRLGGAPRPAIEHGSERGYQQHRATDGRHRRTHPEACNQCIDAHVAYNRVTKGSLRARRREAVPA